jgi:hypothetical protein
MRIKAGSDLFDFSPPSQALGVAGLFPMVVERLLLGILHWSLLSSQKKEVR